MTTFEELWGRLDHARIAASIKAYTPKDYDFEDAKLCVYEAADRWLLWDLTEFDITGLEAYYESADTEVIKLGGFKAYIDVVGTVRGARASKLFEYMGKSVAIDWKTSKNALDKKWKNNLIMSHQWRMYSELADIQLFMYRGIKRPTPGDPVDFREVILDVPQAARRDGRQQMLTIMGQIEHLNHLIAPWPKHMPDACHKYNRDCPYLTDCDLGRIIEPAVLESRKHSYSRLTQFLTCPEQYRRDRLAQQNEEAEEITSESSEFGKAVHAGLAEVYSQACGVVVQGRR